MKYKCTLFGLQSNTINDFKCREFRTRILACRRAKFAISKHFERSAAAELKIDFHGERVYLLSRISVSKKKKKKQRNKKEYTPSGWLSRDKIAIVGRRYALSAHFGDGESI